MRFLDLTWCVAYYYPQDIIGDVDFFASKTLLWECF